MQVCSHDDQKVWGFSWDLMGRFASPLASPGFSANAYSAVVQAPGDAAAQCLWQLWGVCGASLEVRRFGDWMRFGMYHDVWKLPFANLWKLFFYFLWLCDFHMNGLELINVRDFQLFPMISVSMLYIQSNKCSSGNMFLKAWESSRLWLWSAEFGVKWMKMERTTFQG